MSLLGAQLEDLTSLSTQLTTTEGSIGTVQTSTTSETTTVVEGVRTAASTALAQITTLMGELRTAVEAASTNADGANWTGANRETFIGAYGDFNTAMSTAEVATSDTFANFDTSINTMSSELEEFQSTFSLALTDAQSSVSSMATAVNAQRDNLDQVMNTGMGPV